MSSSSSAPAPAKPRANRFLLRTREKADLNQYWYSPATIDALVAEALDVVEDGGKSLRTAFISTPSLYFSLPPDQRAGCVVLDIDRKFEKDPGYVYYDFNKPEAVPAELMHQFDLVVVDPPFITREVWGLYAKTMTMLLDTSGGRILCTTIAENEKMMAELFGARPQAFRPSIPNLVYQYSCYANYDAKHLQVKNPEVDRDEIE